MKIIGIGNAIVDVICKVDENFLTNNKLTNMLRHGMTQYEIRI